MLAKIDREKKENNTKSTISEHKSSTKTSSSSSENRRKKSREDSKRHHRSNSDHRKHSSSRHKSKSDSGHSKDKGKDSSCNERITREEVPGATNKESTSNNDNKEKFINELHSTIENKIVKDSKSSDVTTTKHGSDHRSSSHRRDSKSSSSSHKRRHSSGRDKSHSSSLKSRKEDSSLEKEKEIHKDKRSSNSLKSNEKQSSTSKTKDINDAVPTRKNSKSGADTSKLKGTVNDGEESTRKEVTEEDVAKAESLIKKITSSSTIIQNLSEYDNDGSEALPTLSSDIEPADSSANDSITEIVSSTVTIKTPDTSGLNIGSDSNPIVWKGEIHMPDVAKFSVTAKQISGTTDYLTVDLKDALKIVGRIAPKTVWDYIAQISESPSKEILLVKLEPSTDDETVNYTTFFNYLQHRER